MSQQQQAIKDHELSEIKRITSTWHKRFVFIAKTSDSGWVVFRNVYTRYGTTRRINNHGISYSNFTRPIISIDKSKILENITKKEYFLTKIKLS